VVDDLAQLDFAASKFVPDVQHLQNRKQHVEQEVKSDDVGAVSFLQENRQSN
jgi:hypothetical protein